MQNKQHYAGSLASTRVLLLMINQLLKPRRQNESDSLEET